MIIRPHVTQCSEVVITRKESRRRWGTRRSRVVVSMYRNRHRERDFVSACLPGYDRGVFAGWESRTYLIACDQK